MRSSSREEIVEVFDALEAGLDRALELSFDILTTPERLAMLQRCETLRRQLPAIEHPLVNQIGEQADATELGGKLADKLTDCLNPAGDFSDDDRARRRGLALGKQDINGMSRLSGWLRPDARATLEAVLAKSAAPGMANPDDQTPVLDTTPVEADILRDTRSPAQRNHDGLNAALRAVLASGKLGQHNGLPASIVVSTTLKELEAAAGKGLTAGGSLLPISDVIPLARHAHHYLAIFDEAKAIGLYHTKRLASPGQRIVLYACAGQFVA